MRLLARVHSSDERARVVAFLESRGIPIYAESGWSVRRPYLGSLFVCIDAQYDDAVALLRNPDHEVAEPVDVAAFWNAAPGTLPTILKGSLEVLAVVIVLVLLVAAVRLFVR